MIGIRIEINVQGQWKGPMSGLEDLRRDQLADELSNYMMSVGLPPPIFKFSYHHVFYFTPRGYKRVGHRITKWVRRQNLPTRLRIGLVTEVSGQTELQFAGDPNLAKQVILQGERCETFGIPKRQNVER